MFKINPYLKKFNCYNSNTGFEFYSNNQQLVEKKAILNDAQMYVKINYEQELRLAKKYLKLANKNYLLHKIFDYPDLIVKK